MMMLNSLDQGIQQVVNLLDTKNYQAAKELYADWMNRVLAEDSYESEAELEWEEEFGN